MQHDVRRSTIEMQLSERKNAPMKTYSRRVSNKTEESLIAKRAAEEVADTDIPAPAKKTRRSSIRSYFEPVRSLSSCAIPTPTQGLNSLQRCEGSPPSSSTSALRVNSPEQTRELQKVRRRLQTKPNLAPIANVSARSVKEDSEGFLELVESYEAGSRLACLEGGSDLVDRPKYERTRATSAPETTLPAIVSDHAPVEFRSGNPSHESTFQSYQTGWDAQAPSPGTSNVLFETVDLSNRRKSKFYKRNLQQSILDLSLDRFRECKECGMLFNLTDKRERTIHDKFHHDAVQGKRPRRSRSEAGQLDKNIDGVQYQMRTLSRTSTAEGRNLFSNALDISYNDLGGLKIDESSLWSNIKNPHDPQDPNTVPRYKVYAFFVERKPVAVLLVERIARGGVYYNGHTTHDQYGQSTLQSGENEAETQHYVSADVSYPVYMAVDRIWTHQDHRRKGLATMLVDNARDTFIQGMVIHKKRVAFSLPTSLGTTFAESYCKGVFQDAKFLVNLDDANCVIDGDNMRQRQTRKA